MYVYLRARACVRFRCFLNSASACDGNHEPHLGGIRCLWRAPVPHLLVLSRSLTNAKFFFFHREAMHRACIRRGYQSVIVAYIRGYV